MIGFHFGEGGGGITHGKRQHNTDLGPPNGEWKAEGGSINAGEGIVIGVV